MDSEHDAISMDDIEANITESEVSTVSYSEPKPADLALGSLIILILLLLTPVWFSTDTYYFGPFSYWGASELGFTFALYCFPWVGYCALIGWLAGSCAAAVGITKLKRAGHFVSSMREVEYYLIAAGVLTVLASVTYIIGCHVFAARHLVVTLGWLPGTVFALLFGLGLLMAVADMLKKPQEVHDQQLQALSSYGMCSDFQGHSNRRDA